MADIKYTHIFKSDKDIEWTINLHDLDYSGASSEVRADIPGFKLSYNSESDSLDTPIKASDVTFPMLIEDSTMETYLSSLLNKQEKKIYITIVKDGLYYWGGVVLTDLIKLNSSAYPYTCELKATDYIGTLKDLTFNPTNFRLLNAGTPELVTTYFADIFSKPFPGTSFFYLNSNKLFTTASPIYETQMSTSVDVFAKTKLTTSAFQDQDDKYTLTYYQVLEQILTAFNCRMFYSEGVYKIVDNRFFNYYTSWREFIYDKDGTAVSNSTYDNHVDCSTSPDTSRIFLADPINEYDAGLKLAQIRLIADADVRSDTSLNPSVTFAIVNTLFHSYRDGLLGADFYAGQSLARLAGGTNQKLKFEFKINNQSLNKNKLKYIYVYISINDGTTTKVLSNRKYYIDGINPVTKKPEPYSWETIDGDQCIILPCSATNVGSFITIESPAIPSGAGPWLINNFSVWVGGDYDVYRKCKFKSGVNSLWATTLNIIPGMICQDLDHNRLPISPQTIVSSLDPNREKIDITQFPTASSAQPRGNNIGFLNPANDIVTGDESKITIELNYIYYLALGVDVDNEGVFFKTENTLEMTEKLYLPNVYIGDAIQTENSNSIRVINSGGSDVFSLAWNIKPALSTQTARPLLQKLTENILAHRYKALKKYQGTLYTDGYAPTIVLRYKSQTLVYNGGSFEASKDEWSGTWHVWQSSLANQSHGAVNTGTKASNVDITKDIYPYIDLPNIDNNLKGLWTSNGDLTAQINVANQLIQIVEKETQDYIGSDPVFTTELSVTTPTLTNTKLNDIILTPANGKFWKIDETGDAITEFQAAPLSAVTIDGIGTINSVSPKVANGAQIDANKDIIFQTADASFPGLISITNQTFAGDKTFDGSIGVGVSPTYKFNVAQTMVVATAATHRAVNVVLSGSPSTATNTYAGVFTNSIAGVTSDNRYGVRGTANSTSGSGSAYGIEGVGLGSGINFGGHFTGNGNGSASRTHIGVFGQATNYSATGSTAIGGRFQINADVNSTGSPKAAAIQAIINFAPDVTHIANNKIFEAVANGAILVSILANGKTFIGGSTTPTALLHLAAGTAAAGTAPLKLTSGTNLTTPENGAFEFDGTNLYFTVGGVRKTVTLV